MKAATKISGEQRRAAIIRAARSVFVEKGFFGTTTRQLANAAGVSEALLFKHFPSKEALYSAILVSCFKAEGAKAMERLQSLEPSTATLVYLVRDLVSHILGAQPDEDQRAFLCLILRSLMDEGEFTRLAIQGGPLHWVQSVEKCIKAARAAGDMVDTLVPAGLGGWFVHQLVAGVLIHWLPGQAVIDYGVPRKELLRHVVSFCLRGIGLKEEAIRRLCNRKESRLP